MKKNENNLTAIEVKDLWFRYEGQDWVLRGVNLDICSGEFVAIVGQNGAGKTTLVKQFNGILKPEKGSVYVHQRNVAETPLSEIATQVGYCYQNPDHQIFNLTVQSELEFGPRHLGFPEDEIEERTNQVLETVSLIGFEKEYPFSLSRGQRQKLAVGTILAINPSVMIIDEPTTGMDWQDGVAMMNLIKLLHETGRTIIMITHDMRIVAEYAERIVVMSEGQVIADGTSQEIFKLQEILSKAFLRAPQITRIAQALSKHGMPPDILTVEASIEAYKQLLH